MDTLPLRFRGTSAGSPIKRFETSPGASRGTSRGTSPARSRRNSISRAGDGEPLQEHGTPYTHTFKFGDNSSSQPLQRTDLGFPVQPVTVVVSGARSALTTKEVLDRVRSVLMEGNPRRHDNDAESVNSFLPDALKESVSITDFSTEVRVGIAAAAESQLRSTGGSRGFTGPHKDAPPTIAESQDAPVVSKPQGSSKIHVRPGLPPLQSVQQQMHDGTQGPGKGMQSPQTSPLSSGRLGKSQVRKDHMHFSSTPKPGGVAEAFVDQAPTGWLRGEESAGLVHQASSTDDGAATIGAPQLSSHVPWMKPNTSPNPATSRSLQHTARGKRNRHKQENKTLPFPVRDQGYQMRMRSKSAKTLGDTISRISQRPLTSSERVSHPLLRAIEKKEAEGPYIFARKHTKRAQEAF